VDTLLNGGIVAVPTDTVYGLAADATKAAAVARLFALKGRDADRAIPLLIGDMKQLRHLTPLEDDEALALLNLHWPGPLTAILPKFQEAFRGVSPFETIGIRMPNHPVALAVLRAIRRPLAVTSANPSGHPPATDATRIEEDFGDRLDLILDAGPTPGPIPSTVLDMTRRPYRVLREGIVTLAQLREQLGPDAVTL